LTTHTLLQESFERYREYNCFSFVDEKPLSYGRVREQVRALRRWLYDRGVRPGDRVVLLSENAPNWGISFLAITSMRAVVVPILTDFHSEEIHRIVEHSGAEVLFLSRRMMKKVPEIYSDERWGVCVDDLSFVPAGTQKQQLLAGKPLGERVPERIPEPGAGEGDDAGKPGELPADTIPEEDDLASLIYTSGTTGSSKGVMLSHRNMVYDAQATSPIPNLAPGERLLSILPLAHTYECTMGFLTPLLLGGHIYYLHKPPAPVVLLPALKKVRPNLMLSVPLLIEKIYRSTVAPKLRGSFISRQLMRFTPTRKMLYRAVGAKLLKTFGGKLRFFGLGGAAVAEDVERFLREARFPYAVGYGLTETSPLVAGTGPGETRFRSTGVPLPGVDIRIADPDPESGEGEIQIKGPNVMQGYYRNEELTRKAFTEDGWFRSGDLGLFDEDGYLYIRGRLKNMILGPSGENIYPEAIESVINEYQFVSESIVFEEEGRLVARVHLDYDAFMEHAKDFAESAMDVSKHAGEYLNNLRKSVNSRLNVFSRVSEFFEESEPFEKTPTKKIKRYLYTTFHPQEAKRQREEEERSEAEHAEEQSEEQSKEQSKEQKGRGTRE
jgi:long-chain acyl-CoA synthetase